MASAFSLHPSSLHSTPFAVADNRPSPRKAPHDAIAFSLSTLALPFRSSYSSRPFSPQQRVSPYLAISPSPFCAKPSQRVRLQSFRAPLQARGSLVTDQVEEDAASDGISEKVQQSVALLKTAAKTRKVAPVEVFSAIRVLEKEKIDPSNFLQVIGGTESPGRTWMLVFTSSAKLVGESFKGGPGGGIYFPVTAVQRFDAAAMELENGIFLGPIGYLTFKGRFSWQKRILAFLYEYLNIKIGSIGPFTFKISKKEDEGRTPWTKDPLFTLFYADEEIIVAKGRGGGIAFWCRCTRVSE